MADSLSLLGRCTVKFSLDFVAIYSISFDLAGLFLLVNSNVSLFSAAHFGHKKKWTETCRFDVFFFFLTERCCSFIPINSLGPYPTSTYQNKCQSIYHVDVLRRVLLEQIFSLVSGSLRISFK